MDIHLNLLEVRPSKIRNAGSGCFAKTVIPAGTVLGPYHGKYMTAKQRAKVQDGTYIWKIHEDRFVDAVRHDKNNPLRYVNGSKTTTQKKKINCEVKFIGTEPENEKVYYITTRTIPKDEELIISYGNNYFPKK